MNRNRALIFGISGQDGALLARFLLDKKYTVIGQTRSDLGQIPYNLVKLGIAPEVQIRHCDTLDAEKVLRLILDAEPDEIYNLSGQSSVGTSFYAPLETHHSHVTVTINILEALRNQKLTSKLFNAGSGEVFGETTLVGAKESSPYRPQNPYAAAKASAAMTLTTYRSLFHVFACTGFLFNHESSLRSPKFVTQKIVTEALRIAGGGYDKLRLGNLRVIRDWGCAIEYVDAMWRTLQQSEAHDYVISTGKGHYLEDFVSSVFAKLSLDWRAHVEIDPALFRASEIEVNVGNPAKSFERLQWRSNIGLDDLVENLIEAAVPPERDRE